jgi:protein NrfD
MNEQLIEVVHGRANHLIDPHMHIWGWEIPVYLFLGGLVAGLMVLVPALELRRGERPASAVARWMPFVAVGLISLGMGALFLDLEHKLYVWRFYLALSLASPMSWGSWLLLLVYPALILLGLGSLNAGERQKVSDRVPGPGRKLLDGLFALADGRRSTILWTSLLGGIALGTYTGLLLGTMVARPSWNTGVLGPLFLASGISGAAALMMLLPMKHEEQRILAGWDSVAIAIELVLIGLMVIDLAGGSQVTSAAADLLLGGPLTPWFWGLVVIAGLCTPLVLNGVELKRRASPTLIAPILVLVGGLALRWILVAAGQSTSFAMLGH